MFKFQEENLIFCYHLSFLALVCLIICNNLHLFLTVHCETIFKFHYWEKNINDVINILSVKTPFFFFSFVNIYWRDHKIYQRYQRWEGTVLSDSKDSNCYVYDIICFERCSSKTLVMNVHVTTTQ